jgi:hypothetical protein
MDLLRRKKYAVLVAEKSGHLRGCEGQLILPNLKEFAPHPPGNSVGESWRITRGEKDVQIRGCTPDKPVQNP